MKKPFRVALLAATLPYCLFRTTLAAASGEEPPYTPVPTLDAVVVTAPRMSSPLLIETDPKRPRQPLPPSDGAGFLKNVPGFTMIRKGGIDGDPMFRGQAGSRLNILIDGSPTLGGCNMRMDPPTAYVFPEAFDRVTILKGPQSVINGGALGNAMAATVSFERDTGRFDAPGVRGDVSFLGGSAGRLDQLSDVTAGFSEGYLRAIATRGVSGDYEDGSGNEVHSRYGRHSGTAIVGWTPDADTLLEATVETSRAYAAYGDRMMDGAKFDRSSQRLRFVRENISPLVTSLKADFHHDHIDHVMDRFSLRSWTGGMMAALSNPDRETTGGSLKMELAPTEGLTVTVGVDTNHDHHSTRTLSAAEYLSGVDYRSKTRVPDFDFRTYGVFAEARQELSNADRVVGGYRFTHVSTQRLGTATNPSDDDNLHSGFARYERDLDIGLPVTVLVGLGHAERAPDYWERTKLFGLNNERTTQLDIGASHRSKDWRVTASLFAAHTDDYIIISDTTARNVDAATWGGEIDASHALTDAWTVDASLAFTWGRNTSDGKPLPQMPPVEGKLGIRYDDGEFLGGIVARMVAAQNRTDVGWGNIIGTDLGDTGGFATFSVNAGWRPKEGVVLTAGIDNILDKTYAEAVSRGSTATLVSDGYTQTTRVNEPGRTLWVKGTVSF